MDCGTFTNRRILFQLEKEFEIGLGKANASSAAKQATTSTVPMPTAPVATERSRQQVSGQQSNNGGKLPETEKPGPANNGSNSGAETGYADPRRSAKVTDNPAKRVTFEMPADTPPAVMGGNGNPPLASKAAGTLQLRSQLASFSSATSPIAFVPPASSVARTTPSPLPRAETAQPAIHSVSVLCKIVERFGKSIEQSSGPSADNSAFQRSMKAPGCTLPKEPPYQPNTGHAVSAMGLSFGSNPKPNAPNPGVQTARPSEPEAATPKQPIIAPAEKQDSDPFFNTMPPSPNQGNDIFQNESAGGSFEGFNFPFDFGISPSRDNLDNSGFNFDDQEMNEVI